MRQRFCRHCGGWHELDAWPVACMPTAPEARSDAIPVPRFISDTMDPTEHVDGRFYTSKSAFRRVTKERGYVELGNDPARLNVPAKPKPDRKANIEAIKQAEHMVANKIPLAAVMK